MTPNQRAATWALILTFERILAEMKIIIEIVKSEHEEE